MKGKVYIPKLKFSETTAGYDKKIIKNKSQWLTLI